MLPPHPNEGLGDPQGACVRLGGWCGAGGTPKGSQGFAGGGPHSQEGLEDPQGPPCLAGGEVGGHWRLVWGWGHPKKR